VSEHSKPYRCDLHKKGIDCFSIHKRWKIFVALDWLHFWISQKKDYSYISY